MQLVIMAAGMGSRFGGLKQATPMGPNDEFILDYSIYDAIKSGFDKVIFIIKEENYNLFKETVGNRIEKSINVEYVFQDINNVPEYVNVPETREKPWGTAHAIYCAKDKVDENFLVINADDFYGRDAFKVAADFLQNKNEKEYATIAYHVSNTMTINGSVKRGVIKDIDGKLENIEECSIENIDGKIIANPLDTDIKYEIEKNTKVSMNLLLFDPSIFNYIEEKMNIFFEKNKEDLSKCEFYIPDILNEAKEEKFATVKVLETTAVWHGVTYKEDTDDVKNSIKEMIEEGIYPNNLWG